MPGTPNAPDADSHAPSLSDLLFRAARGIRHEWIDQLTDRGVAPHHSRALRVLVNDGPMRPGQLAERLRVTPRSATDVVDALLDRGLVERSSDPADRRAVVIGLTDDGRRLAASIDGVREAAAERYLAPLSPTDRAELTRILTLLSADDSG